MKVLLIIFILCFSTYAYAENYHIMIEPKFAEQQSWSGNPETFGQHKWNEQTPYTHIFLSKKELLELIDRGDLKIHGALVRDERKD